MKRKMNLIVLALGLLIASCGDSGDSDNGDNSDDTNGDLENAEDSASGEEALDSDDADSDTVQGLEDSDSTPIDTDFTAYEGFEDMYILTLADDPTDVCRVRFAVAAVGEPDVPCDFCEWDVLVEFGDPEIVADIDGACANSDLALTDESIQSVVGTRVAYGFAREYVGHANNLMRLNSDSGQWEGLVVASYDSETFSLIYDRRDGTCNYAGDDDPDDSTSGICGVSGEATVSD